MENENRFRHEMKFMIPYKDYAGMRKRLGLVMKKDPHAGPDGIYRIRSIYFDNLDNKALREKIDGIERREKFRIRYYNNDLSYMTLEKKMKVDDLCKKCSAKITKEQCKKILDNDIEWMRTYPDELVKEMYAKMRYQRLRPKALVSYVREPYICKAGNVRITFDSKIRTTLHLESFLSPDPPDISATDHPGDMFLEVKFDAFLPGVIQDIIQIPDLRQQSFSKYGACRRFG